MALNTDDLRKKIAKERKLNVDNIEYNNGIFWYCVRGGSNGSATLIQYPLAEYAEST